MSFTTEKKEKYALITVDVDKLDGTKSPSLKSELLMTNSEGYKNIVLNLGPVRYCDSSGLSAILVGNRLCKNSEGVLVICGVQETVMKLITISQLDSILNIVPTPAEAEDMVIMEEVSKGLDKE
ncbi:MAG: STAS domain-containing protein [Flavobacteriales bacterium]|nr:STAS domain-containing protein [Flavobacteriales bacterium]